MLPVPTVLLLHTTDAGRHHDWLIGDPAGRGDPARGPARNDAPPRLWTARVQPASCDWARLGRFELEPLPPHRPVYLHYEGPVGPDGSGRDRGTVRRVDAGYALALLWRPGSPGAPGQAGHAVLAVRMAGFNGRIALHMPADGPWTAHVLDAATTSRD